MQGLVSRLSQFDLSLTEDECAQLKTFIESDSEPAGLQYANEKARAITRVYPRHDVDDPEAHMLAAVAIMSQYPRSVLDRLADPRTGIVGYCKFLPRIAEIKEACIAEVDRRKKLVKNAELIAFRRKNNI